MVVNATSQDLINIGKMKVWPLDSPKKSFFAREAIRKTFRAINVSGSAVVSLAGKSGPKELTGSKKERNL